MDTETLNEYLFADLVTRWATQIAMARASSVARNAPSLDVTAVTTEDLRTALAQLELRRDVVKALRAGISPTTPVR